MKNIEIADINIQKKTKTIMVTISIKEDVKEKLNYISQFYQTPKSSLLAEYINQEYERVMNHQNQES